VREEPHPNDCKLSLAISLKDDSSPIIVAKKVPLRNGRIGTLSVLFPFLSINSKMNGCVMSVFPLITNFWLRTSSDFLILKLSLVVTTFTGILVSLAGMGVTSLTGAGVTLTGIDLIVGESAQACVSIIVDVKNMITNTE
jgi:hypothetical protein